MVVGWGEGVTPDSLSLIMVGANRKGKYFTTGKKDVLSSDLYDQISELF